ncbi:Gfo/Idh/MocA family protein [Paenibacillus flagellatus]|uniref:Gfo/Idh/MocA family protein n=1 Tax=Paenibacillus flagellatus TaxID=2211139 RepID=UPI001FE6290F|nr:Gfo/Idh/MocA family oxidoreductase [Paenibacillus flagellatus]
MCIIGCTGHAYYTINGLKTRGSGELAGIAPGSPGETIGPLARLAANSGHNPIEYGDYREMLDREKPDIAVVACHFGDHAKVAAEALHLGCHVFVEKPAATTFADLERLKEAYARSGKRLSAMLAYRYIPAFEAAKAAVDRGAIGRIRLLQAQKSYRLNERGAPYRSRVTYGGTIPWVGSHAIDWLYWFSRERFASVYAAHSSEHNRGHGELELTAQCLFVMTGDVFGTVSIDYLRPDGASAASDDRLRIVGTKGTIEIGPRGVLADFGDGEGERPLPLAPRRDMFAEFMDHIANPEAPYSISAEDSFYVTEACLRARQAADDRVLIPF